MDDGCLFIFILLEISSLFFHDFNTQPNEAWVENALTFFLNAPATFVHLGVIFLKNASRFKSEVCGAYIGILFIYLLAYNLFIEACSYNLSVDYVYNPYT